MKLVEIPIKRFLAETPLTRDTYIFLPLNKKAIRIAFAGSEIPAEMLSRILAKGFSHLQISESSQIDPETFAIHEAPPAPMQASPEMANEAVPAENKPSEEAIVVSSPKAPDEPEQALAFSQEASKEEESLVKAYKEEEEPSQSFSGSQKAEEISKVGATPEEESEESRLEASIEEAEKENRFGSDAGAAEAKQRFSETEKKAEKYVRKFATEKDPLPAVIRLQKKMIEAKGNELSIDLGAEKEQALKEAKAVILSSKISEKIISLSEQARPSDPKLQDSIRDQVRVLKKTLEKIDEGDLSIEEKAESDTKEEIAEITESLASASRSEQVEEISERLAAHALTRELAMAALDGQEEPKENESGRNSASRDLPATVSRLAAYLGHSLGYTNVDFLADLGCGAIAHFARKDGEELIEDLLPTFSKRIISNGEYIDDAVTDSRQILQFLEIYLNDGECDRSHKDLMKRIFDRTVKEISAKEDSPSPWSLKKWQSFVERGPTMDSHSICTRASSKAVKAARNASA